MPEFNINKKHLTFLVCTLFGIVAILFFFRKSDKTSGIQVGILAPLSGGYAPYGICAKNGIELAVNEINESGGINGKKINCIFYDDEGDPAKSAIGYNYLKDQNVSAIIMGGGSPTALSVVSSFDEPEIPILVGTASAEGVTYNKDTNKVFENVFRIGYTNAYQGRKLADFAKSVDAKKVATLFCAEDDYSSGLKDAFVESCKSQGITVTNVENFSMKSVDFQGQLGNIKKSNPDLLFVSSHYELAGLIVQQSRNLGISCSIIGGDAWNGISDYVSNTSSLNKCFYCNSFAPDDPTGPSQAFTSSYKNKYNELPTYCSAGGYDSVKVLSSSLSKSLEKNLKINSDEFRKDIIDNLKSTNVESIAGNITFDDYHNPKKQAIIIQIKDGKEQFYQKI